jgi:simple sugar transport system substrate-binding protein
MCMGGAEVGRKLRIGIVVLGTMALTTASIGPVAAQEEGAGEPVQVALIRQLAEGDYFQLWQAGAQRQADALGIDMTIYNASGDNARQALDLETALNAGPDAIIIDHGFVETMAPAAKMALDAGVPVVAFDVDTQDDRAIQLEQSDGDIARLALEQLVADTGGEGDVLYVYVAGFAPLDRRNAVWEEAKVANPGLNQVAQIGAVNESTAVTVADQAKAALQANPNVVAVFAPYDEFAKGATLAIEELGLQDQIKVYGADISTADIAVMTAEDSPWVATVAADPGNVGAVSVRAAYLAAMGEDVPNLVVVPVALITQADLLAGGVQNMEQLASAVPTLQTPDLLPVEMAE